jgi:hypothetical protein
MNGFPLPETPPAFFGRDCRLGISGSRNGVLKQTGQWVLYVGRNRKRLGLTKQQIRNEEIQQGGLVRFVRAFDFRQIL